MINDTEKFLKYPLGEDEKDKKKRLKEDEKKRKDKETEEEDGIICEEEKASGQTPFDRWQLSLMNSRNIGKSLKLTMCY